MNKFENLLQACHNPSGELSVLQIDFVLDTLLVVRVTF